MTTATKRNRRINRVVAADFRVNFDKPRNRRVGFFRKHETAIRMASAALFASLVACAFCVGTVALAFQLAIGSADPVLQLVWIWSLIGLVASFLVAGTN